MSAEPIQVSIRIMDKDYRIACQPHEQEGLRDSARMLDGKMREIRQTGRVIGSDRIAVMAALNIAYDLIKMQDGTPTARDPDTDRRLSRLQEKIAGALAEDSSTQERPEEAPPSPDTAELTANAADETAA